MNKEQYAYDKMVQNRNKKISKKLLAKKVNYLEDVAEVIYTEGQSDKSRNNRQHTLVEYHNQINLCQKKKEKMKRKLKYLKYKLKKDRQKNKDNSSNTKDNSSNTKDN